MNPKTIVVVGGGYAGLHTIAALRKEWENAAGQDVRFVLMDRNPFHFKKVLLVKAACRQVELRMPFDSIGWSNVHFVQGSLTHVNPSGQIMYYKSENGTESELSYDQLVVTVGSVVRDPDPDSGGIPLRGENDVRAIRSEMEALLRTASEAPPTEREKLLQVVVVGGGISGIETAAELAAKLREEANGLGLPVTKPFVSLIHAGNRLLAEAPERIGRRLERKLTRLGVKVILETKAVKFNKDGRSLQLENEQIDASLCIWTLGLTPNPLLRHLDLPLHEDGRLLVDGSYRVHGYANVYAIGDCAHVFDSSTGHVDAMTCKEAIPQGKRLASIMKADLLGYPAPLHKSYPGSVYAIGLGPDNGFLWTRQWGIDFVVSGKLGGKAKEYAWNFASTVK